MANKLSADHADTFLFVSSCSLLFLLFTFILSFFGEHVCLLFQAVTQRHQANTVLFLFFSSSLTSFSFVFLFLTICHQTMPSPPSLHSICIFSTIFNISAAQQTSTFHLPPYSNYVTDYLTRTQLTP